MFGFGQALGTRSKHQPAADLAALSAAQVMRGTYGCSSLPCWRAVCRIHVTSRTPPTSRSRARPPCAEHGANRVAPARVEVTFPEAGFAPTRVTVSVQGEARIRRAGRPRRPDRIEMSARATAELAPGRTTRHRAGPRRRRPDLPRARPRRVAARRVTPAQGRGRRGLSSGRWPRGALPTMHGDDPVAMAPMAA
jgi:hypothetical protein